MILLFVVPMAVALFSSAVEPCPDIDPIDHTVLIADPEDCTAFFACVNGVPIKQYCPAGLHFNDKLDVCEWPEDAKCRVDSPGTTAQEHWYTCIVYITVTTQDGQTKVNETSEKMQGIACSTSTSTGPPYSWSCTSYNPCLD